MVSLHLYGIKLITCYNYYKNYGIKNVNHTLTFISNLIYKWRYCQYKYIVIQKTIMKCRPEMSYRDASVFINLIYPDKKISHNAVGERLRKDRTVL